MRKVYSSKRKIQTGGNKVPTPVKESARKDENVALLGGRCALLASARLAARNAGSHLGLLLGRHRKGEAELPVEAARSLRGAESTVDRNRQPVLGAGTVPQAPTCHFAELRHDHSVAARPERLDHLDQIRGGRSVTREVRVATDGRGHRRPDDVRVAQDQPRFARDATLIDPQSRLPTLDLNF